MSRRRTKTAKAVAPMSPRKSMATWGPTVASYLEKAGQSADGGLAGARALRELIERSVKCRHVTRL